MAGVGLEEGKYDLLGQTVTVKNGKAFLSDDTIAGSVATLDYCVRNMVTKVGVSLKEAVRMASMNPAVVIGFDDEIGSITTDRFADITLLDEKMSVQAVFIRGDLRYKL